VKLVNVTVLRARPGYRTIHKWDSSWEVASTDVIAWRVETNTSADGSLSSEPFPIDVFGDPPAGFAGFVDPEGRVALAGERFFASFKEFLEHAADNGEDVTYPLELAE
jgi:hypothetical protein